MSVSGEVRDEAAWAIRGVLREHGEMSSKEIARLCGVNPRRVAAVCRWLVSSRELLEREVAGAGWAWRLPGQRPDLDLRRVLEVAAASGVDAGVGEWRGRPRVRAAHPFSGEGLVWLDCESDVEWYVADRGVAV